MKKFRVNAREVHVQTYIVEAETAEQALKAVASGEGIAEDFTEYLHMLDLDTWTAEEVKDGRS